MKNKHLRHLIIAGTLVLTGLFLVQIYWFQKAFDAQARQFDHSVQIALMRVADSVARHAEVKRLSSNFFFVQTESRLDGQALDTLLRIELSKRDILLDYELGVYNADNDTLVYGQYIEATKKQKFEQRAPGDANEKNFAVFFPKKESYVVAQLDVWIFSTIALLLMVCFFAYAIATLLRERRFAELKTDFINNMTHEFKTPVTNIGITGEIIRKKVPEEAGVNVYVDILLRENEKLRTKIDEVLLGSSLEHVNRRRLERFDIHELISESAEAFNLKVRERQGRLQLELNARSTFILGDRDLLAQAINNVIDNAEKYSPHSPYIVVRTIDSGEAIEIDVRDHGVGIPEKLQKKVFEKFFRAQTGDVRNIKGFGLGLNFVKNVIHSHRGKVSVVSRIEEGTEIRILIPKA
jgi:two-component system, OmpR family, phosphate regulon sensor histidine kinase PhoR